MTYADRTSLRERPGRSSSFPDDVAPLASDIPEGMTIAAYRRSRHSRARWWRRILVGRGAAGHP